ncbi:hypothetical protein AUF62_00025 [archaeon 13_1_20CM_52_20]|nr:MAG: hypothetical protein AUF62_00025 [archaeon 13_1_20CM_52_20]
MLLGETLVPTMGNGLDWCMEESPKRKWSDGEREAAVISFSTPVIASAVLGLLVYETTVPFCRGAPCPARESLSVISTTVNSPTNVTLRIINSGSVAVSLASYYVKDAYGQTYANSNWAGPNISPNTTLSLNLLIDGKSFSFQHGSSYAIIVVTSRNNQYTFTVTA